MNLKKKLRKSTAILLLPFGILMFVLFIAFVTQFSSVIGAEVTAQMFRYTQLPPNSEIINFEVRNCSASRCEHKTAYLEFRTSLDNEEVKLFFDVEHLDMGCLREELEVQTIRDFGVFEDGVYRLCKTYYYDDPFVSDLVHEIPTYTETISLENADYPFVIENDIIQYEDGWYRDCFFNVSGWIEPLDNASLDVFDDIHLTVNTENGEFSVPVIIEENRIYFNSGDGVRRPVSVWLEHESSGEQLTPTIPISIINCRTLVSFNLAQVSNFSD